MSNNYHFFGCSWTGWHKSNYVEEMSKIIPNHNFYNWGCSGSSISISTFILDAVKKKFHRDNNYFIFQCTSPCRVSWWDEKFGDILVYCATQHEDNYFKLDSLKGRHWEGFSPNSVNDQDQKYHRLYYSKNTNSVMHHEYAIHCKYAEQNSDYIFWQRERHIDYNIFNNPKAVDLECGNRYETYLSDDGFHFGSDGVKWQADWLIKELNIEV